MEHKSKDTKGNFRIAQSAMEKGVATTLGGGMNSMCVLERKEGSEINDDCKSGACSLWGPQHHSGPWGIKRPIQETPSKGSIWLLTLCNYVSV